MALEMLARHERMGGKSHRWAALRYSHQRRHCGRHPSQDIASDDTRPRRSSYRGEANSRRVVGAILDDPHHQGDGITHAQSGDRGRSRTRSEQKQVERAARMGRSGYGDERQALQFRASHLSDRSDIPGGIGSQHHARQSHARTGASKEKSARRDDTRSPPSARHLAGWEPNQRDHWRMAGADTLRLQSRA